MVGEPIKWVYRVYSNSPPAVTTDLIRKSNNDNGTIVEFESLEDTGAAFLVFMGQPMDEPVSWRGPIVMSTARQVSTAYRELRNGGFLKKRVNFDYQAQKPTKGPPLTLL